MLSLDWYLLCVRAPLNVLLPCGAAKMMGTAVRIALLEEVRKSEIRKAEAWGDPWAAVGRIGVYRVPDPLLAQRHVDDDTGSRRWCGAQPA